MTFHFTAGRISLDFANTGGEDIHAKLGPVGITYEDLKTPDDCSQWFSASALALPPLAVTQDELAEVRRLRDAIWYNANACREGTYLRPLYREVINAAARQPPLIPQMVEEGHQSTWYEPTLHGALATIARDAIDLFTGEQAQRIRECAGSHCILLFVDTSRPGKRRWCDMERCGNQMKTTSYRRRHGSPSHA